MLPSSAQTKVAQVGANGKTTKLPKKLERFVNYGETKKKKKQKQTTDDKASKTKAGAKPKGRPRKREENTERAQGIDKQGTQEAAAIHEQCAQENDTQGDRMTLGEDEYSDVRRRTSDELAFVNDFDDEEPPEECKPLAGGWLWWKLERVQGCPLGGASTSFEWVPKLAVSEDEDCEGNDGEHETRCKTPDTRPSAALEYGSVTIPSRESQVSLLRQQHETLLANCPQEKKYASPQAAGQKPFLCYRAFAVPSHARCTVCE